MYIGMVKQLDGCSLDSVDSDWTAPWVSSGRELHCYYNTDVSYISECSQRDLWWHWWYLFELNRTSMWI